MTQRGRKVHIAQYYFYRGTLRQTVGLSQSWLCVLQGVGQQFSVGLDCFVVRDVFLSDFWWIYCYNKHGQENTFLSRCFDLSGPREAETSRRECVLLSTLIVTIDPPKDTEKYIPLTFAYFLLVFGLSFYLSMHCSHFLALFCRVSPPCMFIVYQS